MHQSWKGRTSITIIDAIFLLRPSILIPCWTIFIIGYFQTGGNFDCQFFSGGISFTLLMGGIYILNQIFDRKSDRINKKLFLLSKNIFPLRLAILELVGCWAVALYLAWQMPHPFLNFFVVSWILGILYTSPPAKLKARPLIDLVANAIGYGILTFILGSIAAQGYSRAMLLWSLPYALAVGAVFINTTIVDMEGDQRAGEKTTAILLGPVRSRFLALVFVLLALVAAILNQDNLAIYAITPSIIPFVLAIIKSERKFDVLSFRLPPFILAVAAGIVYPPYLIFLALLLIAMRIYYKKRFGIVFPSPVAG